VVVSVSTVLLFFLPPSVLVLPFPLTFLLPISDSLSCMRISPSPVYLSPSFNPIYFSLKPALGFATHLSFADSALSLTLLFCVGL
jgi:hypothetical protein